MEAGHERAAAVFGAGEGGEGDGGGVAAGGVGEFAELGEEFVAVFEGHADVAEDHIGTVAAHGFDAFGGAGGDGDGGVGSDEDALDQIAGVGFVIDDEDVKAAEIGEGCGRLGRGGWRPGVLVRVAVHGGEGEGDGEGGALGGAGTGRLDGSAVQFDERFHESKAEAEAAVTAGHGGFGLAEAGKKLGEEVGGNALAGIDDGDFDVRIDAAKEDLNPPAARREFDGIGKEVPQDLLEAVRIAGDGATLGIKHFGEADAFGVGGRTNGFDGVGDDGLKIDGLDIEAELSVDDAGHVEEFFDELGLCAGVAFDGFEALLEVLRRRGGIGRAEDVGPSQDGIERGAQFVGKGGEKFVLHAADALGFGAGGSFAVEEVFTFAQDALDAGDVARDFGDADDAAGGVFHGGDGDGNIQAASVLADTDGLEVIDTLAAAELVEDFGFFVEAVGGEEDGDGIADHFLGGVAEHAFR